jgi:predicted RNA-binding protein with PUA-like domain
MPFLFKEEPENYSFDAFVKDGTTTWTGVKNPVAQRNLRSVRKGDLVFYYHTGKEKAIVGIAKAAGDAYPDPNDKTGRAYVVDLVPVKKLKRPVTLAAVHADRRFASFHLTRIPRLSVIPVGVTEWAALMAMSEPA